MSREKPLCIVNPKSGGGRSGETIDAVKRVLERYIGEVDAELTQAPRHAVEIARAATLAGRPTIIAVGGDGTTSECVAGIMAAAETSTERPKTKLGLIGQGTGGDFRRTFGFEHRLDAYCQVIADGHTKSIDVGRFSYVDNRGEDASSYFVNILSMGVSGIVDRHVANTSKALGGTVAYFIASARGLLESVVGRVACKLYRGDTIEEVELSSRMIAVCNGQYFGGGMQVGPMAEVDDGLFELVNLGDRSKLGFAIGSSRVYTGAHINSPDVTHHRADKLELRLINEDVSDRFLIDVDGEPLGQLPLTIELMPRALDLLVPSS